MGCFAALNSLFIASILDGLFHGLFIAVKFAYVRMGEL